MQVDKSWGWNQLQGMNFLTCDYKVNEETFSRFG